MPIFPLWSQDDQRHARDWDVQPPTHGCLDVIYCAIDSIAALAFDGLGTTL